MAITKKSKKSAGDGSLATRVDERYNPSARAVKKAKPTSGQLVLNDCYGGARKDRNGFGVGGLGAPPPGKFFTDGNSGVSGSAR